MLASNTRYGLIISADEVMFLRVDVLTGCEYDTADDEPVETLTTPRVYYSDPIKFTDVYNEAGKASVTVRQALWYIIQRAGKDKSGDFYKSEEALAYFATTGAGERYVVPRPSWMKAKQ
jgi:hypothetical protein